MTYIGSVVRIWVESPAVVTFCHSLLSCWFVYDIAPVAHRGAVREIAGSTVAHMRAAEPEVIYFELVEVCRGVRLVEFVEALMVLIQRAQKAHTIALEHCDA